MKISSLESDGISGALMIPAGSGPFPGLLILGGSEGGSEEVRRIASPFVANGYGTLALAYFDAAGLPPTLENIPLEYFDRALATLASSDAIDAGRLGIYGVSKGAEAALLMGSRSRVLRAVAVAMPSCVVWAGIGAQQTSSWSVAGSPLAFLPLDFSQPFDSDDYLGWLYRSYDRALDRLDDHPAAIVPAECCNGPILLISGRDDRLWPATRMSDLIVDRLRKAGFPHVFEHLAFAEAGHAVGVPPAAGASEKGPDEAVGGTREGNAAARELMWAKLIQFFDAALTPS